MKNIVVSVLYVLSVAYVTLSAHAAPFQSWAARPPMGWNSWDCFGAAVKEDQTRANADYMAKYLKQCGWQYIVVDIQWYEPKAKGWGYRKDAMLTMDAYGRLLPAPNRFPSAADGKGFKALADYCHSLGLKFGVHLMRGIPRQAVSNNLPILGTKYRAPDVTDMTKPCKWNSDMWGLDMTKPGAQEYLDSVFKLFAEWGIDYVKIDDLSFPYYSAEIEGYRRAIDKCGRPIVFSASPGGTPIKMGPHVSSNANLWRITGDFWDKWSKLKGMFRELDTWTQYRGEGHWPDADMLPLGSIRNGPTKFTKDEQITLMTLWCIAKSPLMFGGDMPMSDAWTRGLITNDEVIAVNQRSVNNRQLFRDNEKVAWIADVPGSSHKYLAVFNLADAAAGTNVKAMVEIPVSIGALGFSKSCTVRDLWQHKLVATVTNTFAPLIPPHGAGLYRLSGK